MTTYYPLAIGNNWTYKMKDGNTFTNTVTAVNGNTFTMKNSMQDKPATLRKDGDVYWTDSYEVGNFQITLKDGLKKGDTWEIKYKANNIESILTALKNPPQATILSR